MYSADVLTRIHRIIQKKQHTDHEKISDHFIQKPGEVFKDQLEKNFDFSALKNMIDK